MTDNEFKKEIASSLKRISFAFHDMRVLLAIITCFLIPFGFSLSYTLWIYTCLAEKLLEG